MRALILSDIHANLEALQAVLEAASGPEVGGYDEIWNLGDMVGYGASPNQVLDLLRPLTAIDVRGNHDRVCCGLTSSNGFNPIARAAAQWTQVELSAPNLAWLREVPQGPLYPHQPGVACAHGSPLNEDQYILNMRDAWAPLQQMTTAVTFFGHTHIQGGFAQREQDWNELRPLYRNTSPARNEPVAWRMPLLPDLRYLINPGSVGQPRDADWRAAFALYDSDAPEGRGTEITFHRVPYDLTAAQGRILMAGLPERLAARLREGR
jgi:predicted phosphodiesterase